MSVSPDMSPANMKTILLLACVAAAAADLGIATQKGPDASSTGSSTGVIRAGDPLTNDKQPRFFTGFLTSHGPGVSSLLTSQSALSASGNAEVQGYTGGGVDFGGHGVGFGVDTLVSGGGFGKDLESAGASNDVRFGGLRPGIGLAQLGGHPGGNHFNLGVGGNRAFPLQQ